MTQGRVRGRATWAGTAAVLVLATVAIATGTVAGCGATASAQTTVPPSSPTAPPAPGSGAGTTLPEAAPIPAPPLTSSEQKLEVLDKIAIALGLVAFVAYLLRRRSRGSDDEGDSDDREDAPHPYTA